MTGRKKTDKKQNENNNNNNNNNNKKIFGRKEGKKKKNGKKKVKKTRDTSITTMIRITVKATWGTQNNRLVGLVVKASASRAGGPGFESR